MTFEPEFTLESWKNKTRVKATCARCEGDGKAHGSDRPFEWDGKGSCPGPCPVCKGTGWAEISEVECPDSDE